MIDLEKLENIIKKELSMSNKEFNKYFGDSFRVLRQRDECITTRRKAKQFILKCGRDRKKELEKQKKKDKYGDYYCEECDVCGFDNNHFNCDY